MTDKILFRANNLKEAIDRVDNEYKLLNKLQLKDKKDLTASDMEKLFKIARVNALYAKNRLIEEFKNL
jgi:hypothetical protein